jgi:Tol biopolymer transport system component
MKPDGSQRTAVTTADFDIPLRVSASPDGATIAYDLTSQIVLTNVVTQQRTPLGVEGIAPSFSPDGQTIAFYGRGGFDLKVMSVNGSNVRTVLTGAFQQWQPPQWTADGNWLFATARFVNVADGTVLPIPALSSYSQLAIKPPVGR